MKFIVTKVVTLIGLCSILLSSLSFAAAGEGSSNEAMVNNMEDERNEPNFKTSYLRRLKRSDALETNVIGEHEFEAFSDEVPEQDYGLDEGENKVRALNRYYGYYGRPYYGYGYRRGYYRPYYRRHYGRYRPYYRRRYYSGRSGRRYYEDD